jgi:hypothetical protein
MAKSSKEALVRTPSLSRTVQDAYFDALSTIIDSTERGPELVIQYGNVRTRRPQVITPGSPRPQSAMVETLMGGLEASEVSSI